MAASTDFRIARLSMSCSIMSQMRRYGFGFLAQRLIARLTRLSLFQLSRQARFFCLCLVELGFAIRQFRREGILLLLELVKLCFRSPTQCAFASMARRAPLTHISGAHFLPARSARCCRLGLHQAGRLACAFAAALRQRVCRFLRLGLKRRIAHRQFVRSAVAWH